VVQVCGLRKTERPADGSAVAQVCTDRILVAGATRGVSSVWRRSLVDHKQLDLWAFVEPIQAREGVARRRDANDPELLDRCGFTGCIVAGSGRSEILVRGADEERATVFEVVMWTAGGRSAREPHRCLSSRC